MFLILMIWLDYHPISHQIPVYMLGRDVGLGLKMPTSLSKEKLVGAELEFVILFRWRILYQDMPIFASKTRLKNFAPENFKRWGKAMLVKT